jgi:hypothetical protein
LKIVGLTNITRSNMPEPFFPEGVVDCGILVVFLMQIPIGVSKALFQAIEPTLQDESIGETLATRLQELFHAAESAMDDSAYNDRIHKIKIVRAVNQNGTIVPHAEEQLIKSRVIPPPDRYYGEFTRGIVFMLPVEEHIAF